MHNEVGSFGYLDRVNKLKQRPTALDELNESIDWSCFKSVLKEHLNFKDRSKGGRKPLDGILMFKVLILQKYYNLIPIRKKFGPNRYIFCNLGSRNRGDADRSPKQS
ncbi:hypothetical protein QEH59_11200, partial [Coraliomargarita sp. SDUM461004]|nr:hypothetical protein [Coraliomargarita sp. SDUM461004]